MFQASLHLFTNLNFKSRLVKYVLGQRSVKFFYKGSAGIFSFMGHRVSAAVSQSQCCSVKVTIDSIQINESAWVPTKLYLQKR